jgi:hypothetical protein
MKKLCLIVGLTLILAASGGQGYHGFGISPAIGQPPPYPPPPPYNNPYYVPQPYNYYNYYSAPNADPLSQFLFYLAPQLGEEQEEREREYYEHRGRAGEGFRHGHEGVERGRRGHDRD